MRHFKPLLFTLILVFLGMTTTWSQNAKSGTLPTDAEKDISGTAFLDCDTITQEILNVLFRFSYLDAETVQTKSDSLYPFLAPDCVMGNVYKYMLEARTEVNQGHPQQAISDYYKALDLSNETSNNTIKKDIVKGIAVIHSDDERHHISEALVDSAYRIPCHPDSSKCFEANVSLLINKGLYQSLQDDYQSAIGTYDLADSLTNVYEIKNPLFQVAIRNSLGNIYTSQLDDDASALETYKSALDACPKKHNFRFALMNNISSMYLGLGERDSAKTVINKIITQSENPARKVTPYINLGRMDIEDKVYNKAVNNIKKALDYAQESKSDQKIIGAQNMLATAYYLKGDYLLAKPLFESVTQFYSRNPLQEASRLSTERYVHLNEIALVRPDLSKKFSAHLTKHDSIYGEERLERLDNLVSKYEKKILQDSLSTLKVVNENTTLRLKYNRTYIIALLLGLLSLLFISRLIYKRFRREQVTNQTLVFESNELKTLNAQLKDKLSRMSVQAAATPQATPPTDRLEVRGLDKVHLVAPSDILYLRAENEGSRLHLTDGTTIWSTQALKTYYKELEDKLFIKIFRSTIVNLNHISWVNHETLKMNDGEELKIGRTYKKEIVERFR